MADSMEPVVAEVCEEEGKKPDPRVVPRQFNQPPVVEDIIVDHKLNRPEQKPVKIFV